MPNFNKKQTYQGILRGKMTPLCVVAENLLLHADINIWGMYGFTMGMTLIRNFDVYISQLMILNI